MTTTATTMVNAFSAVAVALVATSAVVSAESMRSEAAAMPTGSWPASKGNVYFSEPYTVKKGEVFDGKMKTYQRKDIKCGGQKESGSKTAVFLVEPGATLKNVIIGKDQMEGVHCDQSGCTIQNVWWDDVCEDALSIKGGSASSVSKVIGGGARSADDKVVQHNGLGTVSIEGFYAQDFGKLYRSCGTCGGKSRKVTVKNVYAVNGKKSIVTVNKNWGDQATIENIKIKGKKVDVCAWSQGSTSGEPKELGAGPSGSLCKYSTSTINRPMYRNFGTLRLTRGCCSKAATPSAPLKKLRWLKRLSSEVEHDDASDATPQPLHANADRNPKEPVQAAPAEGSGPVHAMARRERGEGGKHVKKHRSDVNLSHRYAAPQREIHRDRSHSGDRLRHDDARLGRNEAISTMENFEVDKRLKRRRKLEEKDGNVDQPKRRPAALVVKEEGENPSLVHLVKSEPPIDPAKAKAAALRQRRMRKLLARRKATGEYDRLNAIKLKRLESSEASRIQKNQRQQMRKAKKSAPIDTDIHTKNEIEHRPRPPPLSTEEAKERKRMLERQRRAAKKAKKDHSLQVNYAVPTLRRSVVGQIDRGIQQKEMNGVLDAFGVDCHSNREVQPSRTRHALQNERQGQSQGDFENTTATVENETNSAGASCDMDKNRPTNSHEADGVPSSEVHHMVEKVHMNERGGRNPSFPSHDKEVGDLKIGRAIGQSSENSVKESDLTKNTDQSAPCRDNIGPEEDREEGQVDSPALTNCKPVELQDDEKKDMLLDMMPIPRKPTRDEPATTGTATFVIPKRSISVKPEQPGHRAVSQAKPHGDNSPLGVFVSESLKPQLEPGLSSRDPNLPHRKRAKNPVPVKNSIISSEDRSLMRLAKKRNSIFMAAQELVSWASDREGRDINILLTTHMSGYEAYDEEGHVLPDLTPRLSCATKEEMASNKSSFTGSFYGVSMSSPVAKQIANADPEECNDDNRKWPDINCYEKLRFQRPEDREFYQRRLYGTAFVPLPMRGRTTLIVRNARYERKSTGIRFNQDRDREEFAASLSKRYTFNDSIPRCDIPRDNWLNISRNRPANVYLHYYNREDAERASRFFRDDMGNPLELRHEYKAGVVISRSTSPIGTGRPKQQLRRIRSRSSERSMPEPSPSSSQGNNLHTTPYWRREDQRTGNWHTRKERLPPLQWSEEEDRHCLSGDGHRLPLPHLGCRSKSRSRSRSKPRSICDQSCDRAVNQSGDGIEKESTVVLPGKLESETVPSSSEKLPAEKEVGRGDLQKTSSPVRSQVADTKMQKRISNSSISVSATFQSKDVHEQGGGGDEDEQEEGEIECSPISKAKSREGYGGGDRSDNVRNESPPRRWHQPEDSRQRYEDYRGDLRNGWGESGRDFQPYEPQYNRGHDRRRSRSRSRPRRDAWDGDVRSDNSWGDRYIQERHRSREFGARDGYDVDHRGRHIYSDGGVDHYAERDYHDESGDSIVKSTYSGSKGLHDLAKATGRYMGTATDNDELSDPYYVKQLKNISEFGMITPANAMKVRNQHPDLVC
ncbi:unnamed protein product [Phytophthora lilii]|uniref:Probable pectate lyase F n=1 Tax=Phytophthora lilii TaxID=2077276 RepID=A0A9W6T9M0_9STRA|nr:unnamed protein product [Phytophthora lilii]